MDVLGILGRLGQGYLLEELCAALAATAEESVATGKPGTVTLTLKVAAPHQFARTVTVSETIARSSPKKDPKGALLFADGGTLHTDDPRQTRMPLRTVDPETGEIDETTAATGTGDGRGRP